MIPAMLFLMNDTILDFSLRAIIPPEEERRLRRMTYQDIMNEGGRLFQERPNIHRAEPEAAKRLAALIVARAPTANAALFEIAPSSAGPKITPFVVSLSIEVLAGLYAEFKADRLTRELVDRRVWSRLPRPAAA